MTVWSVVKKSELEGLTRLDAEFYQPKYLKYVKQFENGFKIGDLVKKIIHPKEITRIYSNEGFLFFLAQNIRNNYINWHIQKRMPNCNKPSINRNKLLHGDVVVVRSGVNYGDTTYFENIREEVFASADVLVIRPNKIKGAYLATFLNTKQGKNLLKRIGYGAAQPHITPSAIKEIKIPIFSEDFVKDICSLISRSKYLKNLSNELYKQAEQILLEESGLKDLDLKDDLFYTTTLKKVKENDRMDAEYYIPKYEELIAHIRNYKNGYCGLLDITQNITINYDPLKEGERFRYIELSNIQASIGVIENAKRLRTEDAPSRAKRKLKKGDVIVSSIKGSLDKTAMVVSDFDGAFASNGFFQFRAKSVNPAYLTLLVKSDIVYLQLFKEASGAILSAVPKESLKNIIIPKLEKNIQEEISKLVQNAHEKYYKSKLLLEQAKHKVEEMIEKEAGIK